MRKFGAMLAATMAMLGMATSTASAGVPPTTVGPPDLTITANSEIVVPATWLNLTSNGTTSYAVPFDGKLTSFSARMASCSGTCHLRLLVLRESVAPSYQVIAASQSQVGVTGVNSFTTSLDVLQGDQLALEWDNGSIKLASIAGATNNYWEGAVGGASTVTFTDDAGGLVALFSAQLEAPVATTVDVDAPASTTIGGQTTYTTHVNRVSGSDRSVIAGTVSLTDDGTPITGCQAVPVTAGDASCTTTLTGDPGNHYVTATYSGDSPFEASTGSVHFSAKAVTATTAGTSVAGPFDPSGAITYTANVSPAPGAGFVTALAMANKGTVAFSVDGVAVSDCATRTVDSVTGVATCTTTAPATGVDHVVKADYSGGTFYLTSAGQAPFKLKAPAVSLPASADAGTVQVGKNSSASVTLTNSGTLALHVQSAAVSGASEFAIATDTCSGVVVEPGATCVVTVAFTPTASGARTATLTFADDAAGAPHSVGLTGTAVLDTPPTGATFAPGRATTLRTFGGSATPSLTVPLRCPAEQECDVDGTLTTSLSTSVGTARAAKTATATVARFSRVHIAGGKVKKLKLRLDPKFVRKAQKAGARRIKATLTINTTLGSGQKVTTQQKLTLLLPKAPKKAKAAPAPHFTG